MLNKSRKVRNANVDEQGDKMSLMQRIDAAIEREFRYRDDGYQSRVRSLLEAKKRALELRRDVARECREDDEDEDAHERKLERIDRAIEKLDDKNAKPKEMEDAALRASRDSDDEEGGGAEDEEGDRYEEDEEEKHDEKEDDDEEVDEKMGAILDRATPGVRTIVKLGIVTEKDYVR